MPTGTLSRTISGIRTLLQTTWSACWKRFCSQRTSAISTLNVSRRCALQIYILLPYYIQALSDLKLVCSVPVFWLMAIFSHSVAKILPTKLYCLMTEERFYQPNYTAWWPRNMCVSDLPTVITDRHKHRKTTCTCSVVNVFSGSVVTQRRCDGKLRTHLAASTFRKLCGKTYQHRFLSHKFTGYLANVLCDTG